MLASAISKSVDRNECRLSDNGVAKGKYRENVLIESNNKLQYAIAYNELIFSYGDNFNYWLRIGLAIGVIALIALGVGLGLFLYQKKKPKPVSEGLLNSISKVETKLILLFEHLNIGTA